MGRVWSLEKDSTLWASVADRGSVIASQCTIESGMNVYMFETLGQAE